jgi:hypothetical protein
MSGMNQLNVKNQLVYFVKQKLDKGGITLDPDSAGLMNRMISHAIDRMMLVKALENPGRMIHAQEALSDFIEALGKQAKSMGCHPEVTQKVFDRVKLEKCPLWPLC